MAGGRSSSRGGAGFTAGAAAIGAGFDAWCAHATEINPRISSLRMSAPSSTARGPGREVGRHAARELAVDERRLAHLSVRVRLVLAHEVLRPDHPVRVDPRLPRDLDRLGERLG